MINNLYITKSIYNEICKSLETNIYESGGIVGGDYCCNKVYDFIYDDEPIYSTASSYFPNTKKLKSYMELNWNTREIQFIGLVHSHINNSEISVEDIEYARTFLQSNSYYQYIVMGIAKMNLFHRVEKIDWYRVSLKDVSLLKIDFISSI